MWHAIDSRGKLQRQYYCGGGDILFNSALYYFSTAGCSEASSSAQSSAPNQWRWQMTDFPSLQSLSEADDLKKAWVVGQWIRCLKLINKPSKSCTAVCMCPCLLQKKGCRGIFFLFFLLPLFSHLQNLRPLKDLWSRRHPVAQSNRLSQSDKQRSVLFNKVTFVMLDLRGPHICITLGLDM